MPSFLRLDKGTETGVMAAMHAFLRRNHGDIDPCDTVLYGPLTSNQVSMIELNTLITSEIIDRRVILMHLDLVYYLDPVHHNYLKCL